MSFWYEDDTSYCTECGTIPPNDLDYTDPENLEEKIMCIIQHYDCFGECSFLTGIEKAVKVAEECVSQNIFTAKFIIDTARSYAE